MYVSDGTMGNQAPIAEDRTMPNVDLIKMTRGLRGKGNKDKKVEYQGINDAAPRPDNVVDAILGLVDQDLQKLWDRFVIGYNEMSFEAIADPIAAYIDPTWDDEKVKAFRGTVNQFSKLMGKDKEEIAEKLLAEMNATA